MSRYFEVPYTTNGRNDKLNPRKVAKRAAMKMHALKTGKAFRRWMKAQRRAKRSAA